MNTIVLTRDIEERLERLVQATGQDKSTLIQQVLTQGMDDLEDVLEADAVLSRIRSGEEPTYSLTEIEDQLGLAD